MKVSVVGFQGLALLLPQAEPAAGLLYDATRLSINGYARLLALMQGQSEPPDPAAPRPGAYRDGPRPDGRRAVAPAHHRLDRRRVEGEVVREVIATYDKLPGSGALIVGETPCESPPGQHI